MPTTLAWPALPAKVPELRVGAGTGLLGLPFSSTSQSHRSPLMPSLGTGATVGMGSQHQGQRRLRHSSWLVAEEVTAATVTAVLDPSALQFCQSLLCLHEPCTLSSGRGVPGFSWESYHWERLGSPRNIKAPHLWFPSNPPGQHPVSTWILQVPQTQQWGGLGTPHLTYLRGQQTQAQPQLSGWQEHHQWRGRQHRAAQG